MASLLQYSTLPLSNNHCSSSLPSLTCHLSKRSNRNTQKLLEKKKYHIKKSLICQSGIDELAFIELPGTKEAKAELIGSLKLKLLSAVSGLNRGLAASEEDLKKADAAAKELESCAGAVDLSADLDKLQGRWKLIYSSAFSGRTLGGSRPGPPTGRLLPITLGQVFQRIDVLSKDFDNIVELELGAPWPLPPAELTATLAHKFELIGSSTIKITFEKTTVKTTGILSQLPPFEVPRIPDQLRPPSNTGSGEFEVTYIDSDTRVTRGDRGELRVFVIS
ncbi:probable plastid-lipid-associated protein 6, chloroplastic [Nicotiana tabacum]|uniref:Harpin binding protein 1 n=1 Tax=Nicotiana tabacum TaxID=4097 RepID=Q5QJB2_TOBAC|nr:probable plastid-lipid-associated protein 6, chloroplastic [Nicotiana tabacum]AAR26483.1 harpin binding protein 1 [Nicotiana tabacum]QSD96872.1 harpin-binding protein [synthetic construct]